MSGAVYKVIATLDSSDEVQMIAKLRDVGGSPQAQRSCKAEISFYRDVADISGVSVPETFMAEYDTDTNRMLLVQEFLSEGHIGTVDTFMPVIDIERVLAALAGMNAKWWNSRELENLTEVRTGDQAMQAGVELFRSGRYDPGKFLARYRARVHPEIAIYYESFSLWGPRIQNGFSRNVTLCHFDCSPKNFYLPNDPGLPPVFFDWSLVIRGNIGIELANLLCLGVDPAEHHRIPELLDFYLAEMTSLGVTDLAYETLWDDFRFGCLIRIAAPIALTSRGYPEADALAMTILPRVTSAVLATNALELLE